MRIFLLFTALIIFTGSALSIGRDCRTNYVKFMNARNSDIKITLKLKNYNNEPDIIVHETILKNNTPLDISISVDLAETSYLLAVENLETGETLQERYGGYIVPNDGDMAVFLINDDGIHFNQLHMFDSDLKGSILHGLHYLGNENSCIDKTVFEKLTK